MIENRVVKGKKFAQITDVDSPARLAQYYAESGADELVFYDIRASLERRKPHLDYIAEAITGIDLPFCIGGGISTLGDIEACLQMGARKVSLNSPALKDPSFLQAAAAKFGPDSIVLAIDVKKDDQGSWQVYLKGGMENTGLDALEWVKKGVELGAGEIVVNSIDGDGMKDGYDLELLKRIKDAVAVPVIASGGAGKLEDFYQAIVQAKVDGVLAASVFHYGEVKIPDLKDYLKAQGISVRL
jgi:cyclase